MKTPSQNLLLVFADEMRGFDTGYAGNSDVHTPNMDRLAKEGTSFTNAISNCPVCTPARGSLLTGKHALGHCAIANGMPIRHDLPTLGTTLRDAGYATGYIGKWHLDGEPPDKFTPPGPRRLGFDEYWAVWNCHHDYFNGRYYEDTPQEKSIDGYEPDIQTEMAIKFMQSHRNDPFALVLSWGPPHGPLELVPDEYRQMYDPRALMLRPNVCPSKTGKWALAVAVPPWSSSEQSDHAYTVDQTEQAIRESLACYYAHITALDRNLGRLMDALNYSGLAENTVVVFTSDHGSMHWSHGAIRKQQPWEESIHVPLLIRAPGQLSGGLSTPVLTGIVDLAPTLLDLLGQPIPQTMDGNSVVSAVLGRAITPQSVLIGIPVPVDGIVDEGVDRGWRGIRTPQYTYACWEGGHGWVLYDLANDPYQMNNLINHPGAATLRRAMESELKRQLNLNHDEFFSWQKCVRLCGVVDEWNAREGPHGRRVEP